jgi:hypothetical protein
MTKWSGISFSRLSEWNALHLSAILWFIALCREVVLPLSSMMALAITSKQRNVETRESLVAHVFLILWRIFLLSWLNKQSQMENCKSNTASYWWRVIYHTIGYNSLNGTNASSATSFRSPLSVLAKCPSAWMFLVNSPNQLRWYVSLSIQCFVGLVVIVWLCFVVYFINRDGNYQ